MERVIFNKFTEGVREAVENIKAGSEKEMAESTKSFRTNFHVPKLSDHVEWKDIELDSGNTVRALKIGKKGKYTTAMNIFLFGVSEDDLGTTKTFVATPQVIVASNKIGEGELCYLQFRLIRKEMNRKKLPVTTIVTDGNISKRAIKSFELTSVAGKSPVIVISEQK